MSKILTSEEAQRVLQGAVDGLLYPSESDEPFFVVRLASPSEVVALAGKAPNRAEPEPTLARFFEGVTKDESWHGAAEKATVLRYRALERIVREDLADARVIRCGEVQVDVFVVGRTADSDWIGLRTRAIET